MSMTVIVTRDVAPRVNGFLTSCMLEIAPGVFTAPTMTAGVRDRVWTVIEDWFDALGGGAIVMTWRDSSTPARQSIRVLGLPPRKIVEIDGMLLLKKER
ncbi:CRISPR-associated protein Cas2 [Azospirillaceae bacterium]